MKKNSKYLFLFAFVFLLAIVGTILVTIFSTPDPQSDITITYQMPDSFDPVKSTQFDPTPVKTATPAPSATATPILNDSTTSSIPGSDWPLTIQDPLGDPILSGTVAYGSESLSFTGGRLIMPATAPRELNIHVSAEGYESKKFTVNPNSPPLVLDYLCDFLIRVEDGSGPVPNATIRVWKSNPPPRPVENRATVYTQKQDRFRLTRKEKECKVTWVDKPTHWSDILRIYNAINSSDERSYPQTGDVVKALETCSWQTGYIPRDLDHKRFLFRNVTFPSTFPLAVKRSCRLRIWDTVCLAERTAPEKAASKFKNTLEVQRENQIKFYHLSFPKCPAKQKPFYEEKTDDKGEWRLYGVSPALYYIQAMKGNHLLSQKMPIYPACGGARLRLWKTSDSFLRVYVEKEGVPARNKHIVRIPDAEITLKSQTDFRVYGKKTNEDGEARFQKLPFGKYRITVKALGQIVEKDVDINKLSNYCTVTVPQEEKYNIAGIVREKNTGDPVAGYALELNTADRRGEGGYYVYQEVISDVNGRFQFHDVIPGKYSLSQDVNSLGDIKYIFSNPSYSFNTIMETNSHLGTIHLDVYEDIHDVKILIQPVVKTTFSGIVVDKKDVPVANAFFKIDAVVSSRFLDTVMVYPEDFRTDASGLFSLSIFHSCKLNESFMITAMTGNLPTFQVVPFEQKAKIYSFVRKRFRPSSLGSVTVEGKMGDTFKDLRIVLEPQVTDKTLQGKLLAEEEIFSWIDISATQKNQDVFVQLNKEGYFKAENISAGEMTLEINPQIKTTVNTPQGSHEYYKYISRRVKIEIKEEHPQTYVEIPLQRAGYYWGYVKDNEGNPLQNIAVWAEDKPSPHGHSFITTDQNGFFFVSRLRWAEGKKCKIKYDELHDTNPQIIPNVPINTGNLELHF